MDIETLQQIKHLFPSLEQSEGIKKIRALGDIYQELNDKVNLISRKDIAHLYTRHILHSLSVGLWFSFEKNKSIADIGTGGGLPGIPLAILFPHTQFTLIDSIKKKTSCLVDIINRLSLHNTTVVCDRVENISNPSFDAVVCRAVAPAKQLVQWSERILKRANHAQKTSGMFFLKGGNLTNELQTIKQKQVKLYPLKEKLAPTFFNEKYLVHIS